METPKEPPKSIWKKRWQGRRAVLFWFALLLLGALGAVYLVGLLSGKSGDAELMVIGLLSAAGLTVVAAAVFFLIRWLSRWRNLRKVLFALVCLVTLLALVYVEENVRGKWAWNKFKREAEARGEKFDFAEFVPPPVPDEQNFAMTPLLRVIYDFSATTSGVRWNDTNTLAQLEAISIYQGVNWSQPEPRIGGPAETNLLTDLEAFQNLFRNNTNYPQAVQSGTPAEDVLVALKKFDRELAEISEAAATRPHSRFPIRYEEEPVFSILLPHLAKMKALCQTYQLRAVAYLETRQSPEALRDIQTAFRLADAIQNEPALICYLVRIALVHISLHSGVRHGLLRHQWNEAQLAQLEDYLASLDLLAAYQQVMRGERAFNLAGLDYYRRMPFYSANPAELYFMNEDGGAQAVSGGGFNLMPDGWYYQNQVAIADYYQEFLLPVIDEKNRRVFPEVSKDLQTTLRESRTTPLNIFAKMLVLALVKTSQRAARVQTSIDQTRLACALERYRLAHNQWPGSLDELAPRFIQQIPQDLFDGKPMRYQKNEDGSYLLYSIGWNEKDEGGKLVIRKGGTTPDPTEGDWVWLMPAKAETGGQKPEDR